MDRCIMIHPNLLTPEFGFVEGCVVETVERGHREFNIFRRIEQVEGTTLWALVFASGWCPVIGLFDSIKPLTGPLSIWNFAPEWAVAAQIKEMGVSWEHSIPEWWDGKSSVVSLRPWWARQNREGEVET